MRTTIDVPEEVLVKAKVFASARRTTLRELVVQGLKQVMDTPLADEEKQRKAAIQRLLKGMQAGNTEPMFPLKREEIYSEDMNNGQDYGEVRVINPFQNGL